MCYSILECLLENLQSQLADLNDNVGQSCLKKTKQKKQNQTVDIRHLKACPCWVSITFIYHSVYQSSVMVISFLSQHSPLVDFKGQPPCSVQQGHYPHVRNGKSDDL